MWFLPLRFMGWAVGIAVVSDRELERMCHDADALLAEDRRVAEALAREAREDGRGAVWGPGG